jgi:starch-binding outer membrane protein, SusD/RagB family
MKRIFYIVILMGVFANCEDILDVKPRASVTDDQVLKDITTTQATLNSAYASLRNANYYGRNFILYPEVMADNCTLVNSADRSGRGQNEATNVKGSSFTHWNTVYVNLNTVNLIIEAIDKGQIPIVTATDQATINRLKAQALFLRGLFHFDLVRAYSYNPNYILTKNGELQDIGVPIILTPTKAKAEIQLPSRPTILSVYEQIERDLLDAINLFTASGSPNTGTPFIASRAATYGLLARVYIYWAGPSYTDKYQLAIDAATQAIADVPTTITLTTTANHVSAWTTSSTHVESLFEVRFASNAENLGGDNSLEGWYTRRFTAAGARTGWGDIVASTNLVSAFNEAGDLRANNSLLAPTTPGIRPSEPATTRETRKYSNITFPGTGGVFGLDNVPVIRLPEMYLIRAEASVKLAAPNEVQARTDLNTIRTRVFATPGTVTETGQALLDRIYLERRRELAFEGHRWFDFTRRGIAVSKPDGNSVPFDDDRILPPLPLDQIQANPNLRQNPGY